MYTSMMGLAVSAILSSAVPEFQTDYRSAKALAARDHKPLVVVLCTGEAAWKGIVPQGGLNEQSLKTLHDSCVCVFIDIDTDRGQRLATDFEFRHGPALIISDRSGEVQAYRHEGTLTSAEMSDVVRLYATAEGLATQTNKQPSYSPPAYFNPLQQQCLT